MRQKLPFAFVLALAVVARGGDPTVPASWPKPLSVEAATERPGSTARQAIASGQFDEAEKILRENISDVRLDFAALRALRAGAKFDPDAEMQSLAKLNLHPVIMNEMALYFYRAARSPHLAEKAVQLVTAHSEWNTSFPELPAAIEAGDYQAIIEMDRLRPTAAAHWPDIAPQIRAMSLLGQTREADARLTDLLAWIRKQGNGRGNWPEVLLQNERVEDCIREFEAHADNEDAFILLADQLRLREAMALPLKDAVRPAQHLDALGLRNAAIELLTKYPPLPETVTNDVEYAGQFRHMGQEKQATEYEDKAWQLMAKVPRGTSSLQMLLPEYALYQEACFWAGGGPEEVGRDKFEAGRQIALNQKKPVLTDDYIERTLSTMRDGSDQYKLRNAFSALMRTGNVDTARKLILTWCDRTHNPTLLSLLGDLALEKGRNAEATEYYLKAATVNRTDASLMYRTGIALSRQAERKAEGVQMMEFAPFLALGDIRGIYGAIQQFEGVSSAKAWVFDYGSRLGDPGTYLGERIAYARDLALQKGDLATALQWQTRALFRSTGEHDDLVYHRLRALDALNRKDNATLTDALQHGLNLGPPDFDLLEKTLPTLRLADKNAADQILVQAIARLTPVVEDYPEAAKFKDELARLHALAR